MEFVDPERGEELLERSKQVVSEDPPNPRRLSSEELHEMLSCWGFVQEPLNPDAGETYIRRAEEYPELEPIPIKPDHRVKNWRLKQAIIAVEAVKQREDYTPNEE